jgi:preprotein translocase subunit SecD
LPALTVFFLSVIGLLAWALWPNTENTARLGLDLQGGTQVILLPEVAEGQSGVLTDDILAQTVSIIRQRVNAFGVAEAEVTVQGSGENAAIVASVPGVNQQRIAQLLKQTARLDFSPVLAVSGQVLAPGDPAAIKEPVPIQADTQEELIDKLGNVDCLDAAVRQGGKVLDPAKYTLTCSIDGSAQYLLEPAFIVGEQITDASPQLPQQSAGGWVVTLEFDAEGSRQLSEVSTRLYTLPSPQNQFAIVLDGLVQSAPFFQEPIVGGSAQIDGQFDATSASELAQILKYGALPVSLEVAEVTSVSATLGTDQLRAGLIAGGIGLLLCALYLILYYRAVGVVAVLSLFFAGVLVYALIVVLGKTIGFTLTLAGVAGIIISIGVTVDSFIVYFERIRDEIREGRTVRQAADYGWVRARRTLLAADFVTLLAAIVLYVLSVGNVRGFAVGLGLATLVDIWMAFLFTRPAVSVLARNKWFQRGGGLTGIQVKNKLNAPASAVPLPKQVSTSNV